MTEPSTDPQIDTAAMEAAAAAEAEAREEKRLALLPVTELVNSPAFAEVRTAIDAAAGAALPYPDVFPHLNALQIIMPRLAAAAPAPLPPPETE